MTKEKLFEQMKREEYPTRNGTGCAIIGTIVIAGIILAIICFSV